MSTNAKFFRTESREQSPPSIILDNTTFLLYPFSIRMHILLNNTSTLTFKRHSYYPKLKPTILLTCLSLISIVYYLGPLQKFIAFTQEVLRAIIEWSYLLERWKKELSHNTESVLHNGPIALSWTSIEQIRKYLDGKRRFSIILSCLCDPVSNVSVYSCSPLYQ